MSIESKISYIESRTNCKRENLFSGLFSSWLAGLIPDDEFDKYLDTWLADFIKGEG